MASMLFGIRNVSTLKIPELSEYGKDASVPLITVVPDPLIYFNGGLDMKSDVICLELSAELVLVTDCDPEELKVSTARLLIPIYNKINKLIFKKKYSFKKKVFKCVVTIKCLILNVN
jgi:hypothetical protein